MVECKDGRSHGRRSAKQEQEGEREEKVLLTKAIENHLGQLQSLCKCKSKLYQEM